MWDTWKRQELNSDCYYDTPLPPTAGSSTESIDNSLENLIGDLAPDELR